MEKGYNIKQKARLEVLVTPPISRQLNLFGRFSAMPEFYTPVSDFPTEKHCPACRHILPKDSFGKDKNRKDGRNVYCKSCVKQKSHDSYQRTLETSRHRKKQYNQRNKESLRIYSANWHQENKERRNKQFKENRKVNREKHSAYERRWRKANPEKTRKYSRDYYQRNTEKRLEDSSRRKALKLSLTVGEVNYQVIVKRDNRTCHICGEKIPRDQLHFDHIIPLSKGGSHSQDNIACAHKKCNLSKGSKIISSKRPIKKEVGL